MARRTLPINGFVMAGGASRRMGSAKAHLLLEGHTMAERQLGLLRTICRSVAIIGPPAEFRPLQVAVFADELAGRGPLAGLYTGLQRTRIEYNLFIGCDLPFIDARFLRYLGERALNSTADGTVPESREHGYHPLCAVYRRRARWAIRNTLAAGENRVSHFFSRVRVDIVKTREIAQAGFGPRIFANMNTPADYEAVRRYLASQSAAFPTRQK